jgi:protein SCO1/2
MIRIRTIFAAFALLALAFGARAQAVPDNTGPAASALPRPLQNVGFEPQINAQLPLDLSFQDEAGNPVELRRYFSAGKPVVLAFVYFSCPMLCDQVQQGVVGALRMLSFNPGKDYEVVFVSFDPHDTPAAAAEKKAADLGHFRRPGTESGWHFLTGSPQSIALLTKAANFRYDYDPQTKLFAHASGVMLLTPDGRISRYFYGVEYPARDLRLGLVDASAGKIGTPIDHVLLYCYHYDPSTARYSAAILKVIRLGGVLTIATIALGIIIFWRREKHPANPPHRAAERGAH